MHVFSTLLLTILLVSGCSTSKAKTAMPVVATTTTGAQQCLALAMYWEARGEGMEGMTAVGAVVLNRVADPRFPDNACAVVHQGGETPPCQFSWWCDGKSDRPADMVAWRRALSLANVMLTEPYRDATSGALYFHNRSVRNPWQLNRTASIGNHIFYR